MAEGLLMLLDAVRQGKVKALSIAMIVEDKDGYGKTLQATSANGDPRYELELLGAMRGAEHFLMARRAERC
jgi:hypothetical protein